LVTDINENILGDYCETANFIPFPGDCIDGRHNVPHSGIGGFWQQR
jgi:hypothetical protein